MPKEKYTKAFKGKVSTQKQAGTAIGKAVKLLLERLKKGKKQKTASKGRGKLLNK